MFCGGSTSAWLDRLLPDHQRERRIPFAARVVGPAKHQWVSARLSTGLDLDLELHAALDTAAGAF